MIEALLFSVRDTIRTLGYDARTCELMADGHPPPRCGDVFIAVHQGSSLSDMDNALNEYFGCSLTLTMRVTIPQDRVGDQLLARELARRPGPGGTPSFNSRAEQLRAVLHMDWVTLGEANNRIAQMSPDANVVYGFCEPARYRGMDVPALVGGEWFGADSEATEVGLVSELRLDGARRLQPIAMYV